MFLFRSLFCIVFIKTGITLSYEVRFLRMTTQNIQKKDMHLNIFAKNQGRAAVLPCPTGSFAPAYLFAARQGRRNTAQIWRGARNLVRMLVVGVDLLAAEG
jgi:hypothetical protein